MLELLHQKLGSLNIACGKVEWIKELASLNGALAIAL
jgi:hypothetical protein